MKNIIKKKLVIAVLFITLVVVIYIFINKSNYISNTDTDNEINNLGKRECIYKFKTENGLAYTDKPEIFQLEYFQSFQSGAFSGKIKNYKPEMAKQFSEFINQLMQENKIKTYRHLNANVCLYHQDLLNPENGSNLDYYIEHYYCTNKCQTGKYDIKVNLETNGTFVGYDEGNVY